MISLDSSLKARCLLLPTSVLFPVLLLTAVTAAGCVVPIPAEELPDAGVNQPPIIRNPNPRFPGPVTLTGDDLYTIDVEDPDLGDTIYVRVFRDYTAERPTPPFPTITVTNDPENGTSFRTVELETYSWCIGAPPNVNLVFEVLVADRPYDSDPAAEPRYQRVTEGGKSTSSFWVAVCPQT